VTTTAETWDTAGSLPVLLQDGATRYVTGPDGLPIEQIGSGGTVLYDLHDQLGSTRALLDGTGATVAAYTYDPYGAVTAYSGTATTPFGYAGQYTDGETGLQYLRARSYDPATAQFLSVDPLVAQTGQPYAYVGADPLNATDPAGLCDIALPVVGRVHVPGTANNPYLCSDKAAQAVLTGLSNVNNSGLSNDLNTGVNEAVIGLGGVIFGTPTVAGGPSSACDTAYAREAAQAQQALNEDTDVASLALLGAGGIRSLPSLARGVAGFAGGLVRGLRGSNAIINAGKYDYLFGRVTSSPHNIARSIQNLAQMTRLGVDDTVAGRTLLQSHLEAVVRDPSNIVETFTNQYGTYQVRESLFAGPSGAFAKFRSTWEVMADGNLKLTTVIPFGGK